MATSQSYHITVFYSQDLTEAVQTQLGEEYVVALGMRYQSPSILEGLNQLKEAQVTSIKVLPLFPQYASATSGSVIEEVGRLTAKWQVIPQLEYINQFLDDEKFLDTIVDNAKSMMREQSYDHYLFSYHGLPERQIYKADIGKCKLGSCCNTCEGENLYCYRAQCFETTRLLAKKLDLKEDQITTCFQSRLGKDPWVQPYTEDKLNELAKDGIKKVLAFSPAFVADCLETTLEVGETYQEEFIEAGGEVWDLVPSLNISPSWVDCVANLVK